MPKPRVKSLSRVVGVVIVLFVLIFVATAKYKRDNPPSPLSFHSGDTALCKLDAPEILSSRNGPDIIIDTFLIPVVVLSYEKLGHYYWVKIPLQPGIYIKTYVQPNNLISRKN